MIVLLEPKDKVPTQAKSSSHRVAPWEAPGTRGLM